MIASEKTSDSDHPHDMEKTVEEGGDAQRENLVLHLDEQEALELARQSPDDALPIGIKYGEYDRDNPRQWPKWRKWYITIVVSMLNVITYVPLDVHAGVILAANCVGHGAQVASRPAQHRCRKHSASPAKSPRCVSPCTC